MHVNDRIRIQSSGAKGLKYGVDFIETEVVPQEIDRPAGAVSVTDTSISSTLRVTITLKRFRRSTKDA